MLPSLRKDGIYYEIIYNFALEMKAKLQFLMLILCMGLFIVPKQLLSAPSQTMECCQQHKSSTKTCHNDKNTSSKPGKDAGCAGNCCTFCGICSVSATPAMASEPFGGPVKRKFVSNAAKTPYKSAFFSIHLMDIWQPPKISLL